MGWHVTKRERKGKERSEKVIIKERKKERGRNRKDKKEKPKRRREKGIEEGQ